MTTSTRPRSTAASALILTLVLLLFGAATFVAGLAVAGSGVASASDPSSSASPAGEPRPTSAAGKSPGPSTEVVVETVSCAEPSEAFSALCDAYEQIKRSYVDEVDDEALVEGAVRGMVEYGLGDPYSGYLPEEQYERALGDLSGEFSGIGAEVGMENLVDADDLEACTVITATCAVVIVAPLEGSPAEAAGLRPGDRILEVDGRSTQGETLHSLVNVIRGEPGTEVTLTIGRDDEELEITVTRAVIDLQEVRAELVDGDIGHVRLTSFTDRSTSLLRDALRSLLDQGARSIVLDLRGNPGGFISAAQGVASQFLPAGQLLFTVESGDDVQRWTADEGGVATDPSIEVVVLVNEGSASASEIVAAALSETGRATIVGTPTFGKNTVQIWTELPNGGGLRLTTDRWFTPEHNSVAPDGIQPDVVVEVPGDPASEDDPQLERAIEVLRGG